MKTAIITGAYGVIGSEIAKGLVKAKYHVILLGKDENKLKNLHYELHTVSEETVVHYYAVDLSIKNEISNLAVKIDASIDVLVNNAATAPRSRIENQDVIELQWATNVLGYYWMMKAFESHIKKSGNGRIVNVASYWAGGLDLNDPEFKYRTYNNDQAYRQSKQANRMLTYGFSELYGDAITVNACHPGDANSKLSNDLGFGGSESGKQAASTPLFLAKESVVSNKTGAYFVNSREARCQFKDDRDGIEKLMELCASY